MLLADLTDSQVTTVVTGLVTIFLSLIGFLTLWVKLRYGVNKAEEAVVNARASAQTLERKIDETSIVATQVKDHVTSCDDRYRALSEAIAHHDNRLLALETQVTSIQTGMAAVDKSVEAVTDNIRSTRHEIRGSLQTITNQISLLTLQRQQTPQIPLLPEASKTDSNQ